MSNYNFHKDLKRSHQSEKHTAGLFFKHYPDKIDNIIPDKTGAYDFQIYLKTGGLVTVEQKEDLRHAKSGNVAIEHFSRGKPSGISRTKADFYLIIAHAKNGPPTYLLIATKELKRLIAEKEYKFEHKTGGDPGSNTCNYLFDFKLLCKYGKVLFNDPKKSKTAVR